MASSKATFIVPAMVSGTRSEHHRRDHVHDEAPTVGVLAPNNGVQSGWLGRLSVQTQSLVGEAALFDEMGRPGLAKIIPRVGARLGAWGVTPNWITAAGVTINIPVMLFVANGYFIPAAAIGLFGSIMDMFDGAVARARGGGTRRGAVLDSVSDRVSESMYMGGIAWYFASAESPRLAVLPLAVLAASFLVSYIRSKAAEFDLSAQVGLMERAERMIFVGVGVVFQTWWNVLPIFLYVMLGLTLLTAGQRFIAVWRQGAVEPPLPPEEIRLFPDFKDLRDQVIATDSGTDDSAVRRAWELQRAEWSQRRDRATARKAAARDEQRRVRARLRSDLSAAKRAAAKDRRTRK